MTAINQLDLQDLLQKLVKTQPTPRSALLPALQAVQAQYGWISFEAAALISHALNVPLAEIQGVIDFYSLLYDQPTGKQVVRVCCDPVCALKGSDTLLQAASLKTGAAEGSNSPDGQFTIERSTCLGLCEHAPAALINQLRALVEVLVV